MLVRPVLEVGCSASLPGWVVDKSKSKETDEIRTWDDRGWRTVWGRSKLVLLSGAASCPERGGRKPG